MDVSVGEMRNEIPCFCVMYVLFFTKQVVLLYKHFNVINSNYCTYIQTIQIQNKITFLT